MSDNYKRKYLQVFNDLIEKDANNFTQLELAEFLKVSPRTISSFKNKKIFNFELLYEYSELIGAPILFETR